MKKFLAIFAFSGLAFSMSAQLLETSTTTTTTKTTKTEVPRDRKVGDKMKHAEGDKMEHKAGDKMKHADEKKMEEKKN